MQVHSGLPLFGQRKNRYVLDGECRIVSKLNILHLSTHYFSTKNENYIANN